ncbi:MAG: BRCT domain-containing protein [Marinomonas sp.]|uniref:BRCT domain-containing protein n=1 Tax=Marinomonas sp. TaxID=1904862 RepID=UPI003C787774
MDRATPNYAIASNKKKAIYSLKGILQGVTADATLNVMEALYLNTWLLEAKPLQSDPDVIDLLDSIKGALEDGKFEPDELDDINSLITDIIEFRCFEDITDSDYINEFLGLISGIIADDVINKDEFTYLVQWIKEHEDLVDDVVVRGVVIKLIEFSELESIRESDKEKLLDFLKKVAGVRFIDTGSVDVHPIGGIADEIKSMDHEGAKICFTGVFDTGSRKEIEAIAHDLGAITRKDPSQSIDYVVIGSKVSPDWKNTSLGRKIQKAVEFREAGFPVVILTEKQWLEFIE